jgi:hypothetical protein
MKLPKLLKNRAFAIAVAAFAVLASVNIGFARAANRITGLFFQKGVYLEDEGYTEPTVYSHIQARADAALGLVSVTVNYPELSALTEELRAARASLLDAGDRISLLRKANDRMTAALYGYGDFETVALSARDRGAVDDYLASFRGAQSAIDGSHYNEKAAEYGKNPLKIFALVKTPEVF